MTNLDFLCMQTAQAMVNAKGKKSDKENLATKALGVLVENGPYGMVLYLETQKQEVAKQYRSNLLDLLKQKDLKRYFNALPEKDDFNQVCDWLRTVAGDLDRYLFVKRLWQQTLTYARYHAKALAENETKEG